MMIVPPYASNGALRRMFEMVDMGGREEKVKSAGRKGSSARDFIRHDLCERNSDGLRTFELDRLIECEVKKALRGCIGQSWRGRAEDPEVGPNTGVEECR